MKNRKLVSRFAFGKGLAANVGASIMFAGLFFGVSADWRNFAWTYQYGTLSPEQSELEFYYTATISDGLDSWEYKIELEHGLTSHSDIAVYQIFSQVENSPLVWDEVQFRYRYRFGDGTSWFINPLLYLEYARPMVSTNPNAFEVKAVLSKSIGSRFDISVDPVYEIVFAPGVKHEVGLDIGLSFAIVPVFSVGLEINNTTEFDTENGGVEAVAKDYIGPTVSGISGNMWFTAGFQFGGTPASDPYRFRLLTGLSF